MQGTDWQTVESNHTAYTRSYQSDQQPEQKDGWEVCLGVDYPTHDLLLTVRNLTDEEAQTLQSILSKHYVLIRENWDGPFLQDEIENQE